MDPRLRRRQTILLFLLFGCFVIFSSHLVYTTYKARQISCVSIGTQELWETLASLLVVYDTYDEQGPISLQRQGRTHDGGYLVPVTALQACDVLLGYGIADDSSFEENCSETYHKPSYGFDGIVQHVPSKSPLFTFVHESIATDGFLYPCAPKDKEGSKITSFEEQLISLQLENKKLFIKMDIEGAEYTAMPQLLKHQQNITGIVLEIHMTNHEELSQAISLLPALNRTFVLVNVHGNNCGGMINHKLRNVEGYLTPALELTYINRSLITRCELSKNQSHPHALELTYINRSLITRCELSKNQSHPHALDQPNTPCRQDIVFTIHPNACESEAYSTANTTDGDQPVDAEIAQLE